MLTNILSKISQNSAVRALGYVIMLLAIIATALLAKAQELSFVYANF